MTLFDTYVQELKYRVLVRVAKLAFSDKLDSQNLLNVAAEIIPDGKPTMRCCIYKERAIINERLRLAMGGDRGHDGVVEVLPIACDECPVDGIVVSEACRGCIAHRCMANCPRNAITIHDHKAVIDKTRCVECGRCMEACPYHAIVKITRPCVNACKADAIKIDTDTRKAVIASDKCVSCGACVYRCPFGAITDKSYITDAIAMINGSCENRAYKVYAVVAPSVASQYKSIPTEKVVAGIKALGFHTVLEAAWGADMVAYTESQELEEKGFLTSSCCPAFVSYTKKNFPTLVPAISHNLSPMAQMGKWIKERDPSGKVVFIGPCIAKKGEANASEYVDCALTFEEMQALFAAKEIDLMSMDGICMDNASYFGRVFARSGGLSVAVEQALKERESAFKADPVVCSGLPECKSALLRASKGALKENFIEGMACEKGCIGGPACLTHSSKDKSLVDDYGKLAMEKTIKDAIGVLEWRTK